MNKEPLRRCPYYDHNRKEVPSDELLGVCSLLNLKGRQRVIDVQNVMRRTKAVKTLILNVFSKKWGGCRAKN